MSDQNVYLGCLECGNVEIEFPSETFSSDEETPFECPNCGFSDMLLANQTVRDYADNFDVALKRGEV
jgi:predicted RNA-binding Zn-ribbon protein involved in translation (DUF1610 family)